MNLSLISRTCLTCKHLDEAESLHKWHACNWKPAAVPPLATISKGLVNIQRPVCDCPAWECRTEVGIAVCPSV